MLTKITDLLTQKTDGRFLFVFRIVFGLIMAYDKIYYIKSRLISDGFLAPKVLFPYYGLEFIKPMSQSTMNAILLLLLISAIFIALGILFKYACCFLGLGTFYFLLLDKGIYNNHIYMFGMVALLLMFTNADKGYSLKSFFSKEKSNNEIEIWQLWLFRFQIVVVYFYGGLTKLNSDWLLSKAPVKAMLSAKKINSDLLLYFFSYGGMLFDITIGFLLLYKPTRIFAFISVLIFNITNNYFFDDIGVFPMAMIFSSILFFNPADFSFLKNAVVYVDKKKKQKNQVSEMSKEEIKVSKRYLLVLGLSLHVVFQLLFPLRFLLSPNDLEWTGEYSFFSWRMKSQTRAYKEFSFFIEDSKSHKKYPVKANTMINPMQIMAMSRDPRMILPFAKYLEQEGLNRNFENPKVFARIQESFNGNPPQFIVDTNLNLAAQEYKLGEKINWLLPQK